MKKSHVVLLVLAVMLAEGALAWWLRPAAAPVAERKSDPRREKRAALRENSGGEEVRQLRRRIRELESRLAEQRSDGERPVKNEEEARPEPRERRGGPPDFAEMRRNLERMAKEDPERYTQMTNRFERGRQWMMNRRQTRADFLASIDVSGMTEHDRSVHQRMMELSARQDALQDVMAPDSGATDEERHAAMEESRGLGRELRGLQNAERDILLGQVAKNLGCSEETAAEMVSTVKEIYNMTERDFGPGGPPGGGRGGWNRRGNRR